MSMFSGPEEHAANPPESWIVCKSGGRWAVVAKTGGQIDFAPTKKAAEELRTRGWAYDLYQKEGRWHRGERVGTWKPYTPRPAEG